MSDLPAVPRAPKIVAFCTPQADVIVALDSEGQLWQRERDSSAGASPSPYTGPRYRWLRIAGPQDATDPAVEAQVEGLRRALYAAKAKS